MLCQAGFASSTPFTGASWELVGEYPILGSNGAVQSVCATEDYIICIENFNDLTTEPDVVSAYYKNDTDADGNPVTQYSLAHQVRDADFAHANGMAYNPVTHEILVSGYSSPDASNYGCIFRLDPDTLEQKERIQLSTSYNILGIDYLPSTGGYLIQTDADGGYGFKLLDASLQVVDDWGTYPFDFYMENFQDLCVSGDLFFLFPLTMHLGIGNFIQTYSLSQKTLLADDTVDFGFSDDITINEPEGLCETNPGEFIAIVNVTKADGGRYVQFYRTRVPYLFTVSTSAAEHGSVSEGGEVSRGEEKTVSYTADEGFRLAKLSVDGLYLPVTEYPDSYTFSDIQKDHTLAVTFEPVPTATPTPTATATPTETPAITQTPEPAISKAPASSTVSFSSVASHFAAFWKGTVHAASWFRHLASAGASLFARIRKADPVFLAMPFVLLVLILLFVLRLRYVRRIRRERSRKALEHRRRTYEELVREFTEDPKDEEVSIDELLLTIDELQKEEQKNT
ncbi:MULTISPECIES: InlB B-repeat-containing protein [Lachnospiraceae]|uniref:Uncharacterized protein n=1 Tax=Fusicatenibacter saccharivorans TaxID=1150298 RepID=A0ABX2GBA4_9FIRM|nr:MULTISPECIES: hypothetical protein [Lachnospiraceae]MDU7836057.1 hypothetical protein [Blautia sp.]NSE09046.1 hypothetical protein [Fusicatenibacter saccharivorans]NSE15259.1 hypothetical protein [Fusicatenibacter saccharivorans]